ncbi:MAG: hypothetical protein EPN82_15660 [Bacteroidetes bacterium]|nr:MAG: hypothetical protein EPN82_15660 [Bacteroidota bacterium]
MRSVALVLVIFIISISLNAQLPGNGNVQVLVKGVITDEYTGKPCESTITIKDKNGKKFKIKSNSIDGTYEQVLAVGENYEFTFINFDVLKKVENIYVESAEKYTEQKADFTVRKLSPGLHLFASDLFASGESVISNSPDDILKELEEILVYNRSAKFGFVVTAHDTYASSSKITDNTKSTKSKKSRQKQNFPSMIKKTNPDEGLVKLLVDNRLKAIEKLTEKFIQRNNHRLSYRADYSLAEPCADAAKLSQYPDFIIEVTEIKNAFE